MKVALQVNTAETKEMEMQFSAHGGYAACGLEGLDCCPVCDSFSGGGVGLPNKGRYGFAATAKPRPGKISQRNLMPWQKVPKNLMTGQVFITFKVPKLKIFSK